ncbi:MAG: AAA family ATPase [Anaerolineales bacterium]
MDLFTHARKEKEDGKEPLAARMRPQTLEDFVGQEHVVGPGRLLRRAIQADQISSLIFYGPPGTGKTTLARIIANTTSSRFVTLNAVLTGVKDLREITSQAKDEKSFYGQRTIVFVDEVHRWNKAQQDALLPWVENGTIIMIGATTENPWFSVNPPLLSRSRVFQLEPLSEENLRTIARNALMDPECGYGKLNVKITTEAMDHLVDVANGDARSLLNALELAVETTAPQQDTVIVDLAVAEDSIQERAVLYDREGDYHFDTISAFIKSLRGSDPDAALYWLAKMVHAGEAPNFIFRRMLILAAEDVGLADPNAVAIVEAAAAAFDRVGLPEGQFHLAEAALYLATAPKSNSALGYFDALEAVKKERTEVPTHLKDSSRDKEGFGHGEGYLYPHAYREHWVAQQYLPDALQGNIFYQPNDQGYEKDVRDKVRRRREEQLAAVVDGELGVGEVLTFSPENRTQERWLMRAVSNAGRRLGELRDRVFEQVTVQRHHLVLDLNAGSGLFVWEALRLAPEGGVWALASDAQTANALRQQSEPLPELRRPVVLQGRLDRLAEILTQNGYEDIRFDVMVGRNVLMRQEDKKGLLLSLYRLLQPDGAISLAETIPRETQRLYDLLETSSLDSRTAQQWQEAEEQIYSDHQAPMVNWDSQDLKEFFEETGFQEVQVVRERIETQRLITSEHIDRWFDTTAEGRPSYVQHLHQHLSRDAIAEIERLFQEQLAGRTCTWHSSIAFVRAELSN